VQQETAADPAANAEVLLAMASPMAALLAAPTAADRVKEMMAPLHQALVMNAELGVAVAAVCSVAHLSTMVAQNLRA